MRRTTVLSVVVLATIVACSVFGAGSKPDRKQQPGREAWVGKCLAELKQIKTGMTREAIENRLRLDGGLQSYVTVRYVHPECSYFKVNVHFSVKRNPDDQNRVVPSPDDKALKVSKPYLESPYFD
jgi:hypothetical protein